MKKLMITLLFLAAAGYVTAQEEAAGSEAIGSDGGTAAVQAAQAKEPAPMAKKFKNAAKLLKECAADYGWSEGWDEKNGGIIVVADADFTCKDPGKDKDFFQKREMAAKRAVLEGKVAIIEMINTEMSASEKFDMPGTDVHKELGAEAAKVMAEMEQQKMLLASLLEKTDKAEAEMLRGTTFGQRLDDAIVAVIKKLDAEYDAGKHDAAAKARYEELKAKCEAAAKEFAALKEKADKLQQSVQARQESAVETMARMPLYGATVLLQTESWNDANGRYQIAVMLCWSKTLERAVRAIVTGENFKTEPGEESVQQWLKKQDLARMLGPRQYIDDQGNRWFLGITARKYDDDMSSTERKKAKGAAESFARQMAAFCVFGDVESYKKAVQAMEVRGEGKDSIDAVAESYAESLSNAFANKNIRGLQKLTSEETEHPISGDDIYVAVYGVNASAAAEALEIEKLNYATRQMDNKHQSEEKGRRQANEEADKNSRNQPEDINRGYNNQKDALRKESENRAGEPKGATVRNPNQGQNVPRKDKVNGSGAFGGDNKVSDPFK